MKNKLYGFILIIFILTLSIGGSIVSDALIKGSSNIYKGVRIVLDAGHGGKDKGAQRADVYESDLNLIYTLKLKNELEKMGMEVILTRSEDVDLANETADNRKSMDLKNRMKIINNGKVDLYISIHMNMYASESVKGAQTFYQKDSDSSKMFASYVQKEIAKISNSSLKSKEGNYYILNNSKHTGILIECGFLSNEEEKSRLLQENYQNKFVEHIRKGIVSFLQHIYE